ncbi:MAG: EAL domain-containing protein [Betaproteobacteria bacterium]|nr:EAL domain-containing protein [Betaproteobacteria bacterium]
MSVLPHTVLLIEDNPGDARLIREMLAEDPEERFRLHCADRLSRGLDFLSSEKTGLVLLDLSLPDSHGLDTFVRVFAHAPQIPIIVLTGNDDDRVALSAVQTGAQDYLVKGRLDRELLMRSMQYSIERKRYQEQLERQANYDTLTGLPNRTLLHDRLKQSVFAQRQVRSIAVVFIDIDHFKFVNDSLGHRVGDELLKCVGERLNLMLRDGDTVARLGGDEFVLILNDQTHQDLIFRAMQRICSKVAEPSVIDGKELYVTCSAGISLYPQDGQDVDTLLKNADAAMYRAKEHGRNNFQFYTAEMNEMVNERLALEQSLRQALEREEFTLYYQPKVSLKNGNIVGAEALLRWRHPERGLVLPERFIHLAEETGLIVPIGEWALREACVQNSLWQKEGLHPVTVSVNFSARQFRHDILVKSVSRILAETGLDPSHLEMELTESIIMHDAEAAIATLRELKALGVSLSIDDFGTGYSSLSYLKDLPIDTLKIDRAFVRDITQGQSDDRVLARAIVSLGHSLGLKVIAEGVENKVQLAFLRKHRCDEVQGFYFSKPVPPEEFSKLLRAAKYPREAAESGSQ